MLIKGLMMADTDKTRRHNPVCYFLLAFLYLAGCPWIESAGSQVNQNETVNPPNIVLFIGDDLGAGDIGPYGNQIVRTPNLDRMAGQSMLFSKAFATSPTCSPSRASIHTGM